jgi:hypothetical protein
VIPGSAFREFIEIFLRKDIFEVMVLWWNDVVPLLSFAIGGVVFVNIVVVGAIEILVVK